MGKAKTKMPAVAGAKISRVNLMEKLKVFLNSSFSRSNRFFEKSGKATCAALTAKRAIGKCIILAEL